MGKSEDLTIIGKWVSPKDDTLEFQIEIDILEDLTFIYTIHWDSIDDTILKGRWILFPDEEMMKKNVFRGRLILEHYDKSHEIDEYQYYYIPKYLLNEQSTIELLKSTKEKSTENLDNREVLFLQDDRGGFVPYFKK